MAHFYGTIKGARGAVSRIGHKASGLRTLAASWQGAVEVELYAGIAGVDFARISLRPHEGRGVNRVLFDGPVSGLSVQEAFAAIEA